MIAEVGGGGGEGDFGGSIPSFFITTSAISAVCYEGVEWNLLKCIYNVGVMFSVLHYITAYNQVEL